MFNPESPIEDEGVVTPENIEITDQLEEDTPELSLVEEDEVSDVEGVDPYNTADKGQKGPDELTNERAANQALAEEAENKRAA